MEAIIPPVEREQLRAELTPERKARDTKKAGNEIYIFSAAECPSLMREIGRLRMSLDAAEPGLEKLVVLHYPPVYTGISAPEIVATLKEYGIRTCYYGHLHGNAIRYAVQGEVDGIRYKLVSADGLRFCPYRIN